MAGRSGRFVHAKKAGHPFGYPASFAGVRRRPVELLVCWGLAACWFAVTFAQAAQVSRRLPWRLRKPRKSRGVCRDVCASCASLAAFAVTFAQAALGLAAFAVGFAVSVPPRLSPWAMVHRPYRPPRRPSIRARGPVWWGVCNTPLPGYVNPQTPLPNHHLLGQLSDLDDVGAGGEG